MGKQTRRNFIGNAPRLDDKHNMGVWVRKVTELLQLSEGQIGDQLDKKVTFRDLKDAGVVSSVSASGVVTPGTGQGESGTEPTYEQPAALSGLSTVSGTSFIFLEWDKQDYFYLSHVEVWRSATNNLGDALKIANTQNTIYVDSVGEGSVVFYYWVRVVSTKDHNGPWNAVPGVSGQSHLSPSHLLDVLSGQVSESQLYGDLNTRINLIDAPGVGLVDSVSAVSTTVSQNSASITANNATLTAAIQAEATTRASETGDLGAQYSVKLDVNGNVSGFGLSSTQTGYDGAVHSQAIFNVDTFSIASPGSTSLSFVVDGGKVLMDAAYISNLVVDDAAISSLSVSKLVGDTAGFVQANVGTLQVTNANISGYIESDNYVPGVSGWHINKGGNFEAVDGTFSGTLQSPEIYGGNIHGAFITGSVIASDTDLTLATEADDGSFTYLCYARVISESVETTVVGDFQNWTYTPYLPLKSANHSLTTNYYRYKDYLISPTVEAEFFGTMGVNPISGYTSYQRIGTLTMDLMLGAAVIISHSFLVFTLHESNNNTESTHTFPWGSLTIKYTHNVTLLTEQYTFTYNYVGFDYRGDALIQAKARLTSWAGTKKIRLSDDAENV